jgi:hypothetical protein
MNELIQNSKAQIVELCKEHKIKRIYAFGSILTNRFNDDSDIDFLVSFSEDLGVLEYAENYFSLLEKLKILFNRKVDLITESSLTNPFFIESIDQSKEIVYEA